nr:hypothetical protein [uncultured Bacteroides sp.]
MREMTFKETVIALAMIFASMFCLEHADSEKFSYQLVLGLALIIADAIYTAIKTKTFTKK